MRILALVTDAFGGYGGIARYNCDLIHALAAASPAVEITVLPRIGPAHPVQITEKIRQARPIMSRILFGIAATMQAIKSRPDVIFCGHIFHGPLALVLAKLTGAKLVSQLHGTEVWQALEWLHLQPLLRSNLVLCVSRDTRARYARQAGTADNSFVLANTVGPVFSVGDRAAAHDRFGVTGHCVLLSVARLDTRDGYKGQDRVIAALPNLRSPRGEPITYLIAGSGADRGRLEQIAAQHGVTEQVRFLGKVSEADLPELYRAADLFVLPSTGEGFGIVYLEAMACGTPALGLAIGGTADPLGDGALGRLLPAEADIFDGLQELLLSEKPDPADLSRTVRAQFGLEAFQLRVAQAIARVTGQSEANVAGAMASTPEQAATALLSSKPGIKADIDDPIA